MIESRYTKVLKLVLFKQI